MDSQPLDVQFIIFNANPLLMHLSLVKVISAALDVQLVDRALISNTHIIYLLHGSYISKNQWNFAS